MLKTTKPMYGLISPSSDGAWLSAFFNIFNIKNVRGSSGRGGIYALNILKSKLLNQEINVAITPDGPRGPAKKMHHGVSVLALQTKADIIILSMKYSSFWTINTWDNFIIPKPFSTITIHGEKFLYEDFKNISTNELTNMLEQKLANLEH